MTDEGYDRGAHADAVADWLEGKRSARLPHDGPDPDPKNPVVTTEVEVGERRERPRDGQPHDAPGIHVMRTDEDDFVERHGSYTVLKPDAVRKR